MTQLRGAYIVRIDGHDPKREGAAQQLQQRIEEQIDDAFRCGSPRAIILVNGRKVGEVPSLHR